MLAIVERVEFIFNSAGEPIQSGIVHYDQTDEGMASICHSDAISQLPNLHD